MQIVESVRLASYALVPVCVSKCELTPQISITTQQASTQGVLLAMRTFLRRGQRTWALHSARYRLLFERVLWILMSSSASAGSNATEEDGNSSVTEHFGEGTWMQLLGVECFGHGKASVSAMVKLGVLL